MGLGATFWSPLVTVHKLAVWQIYSGWNTVGLAAIMEKTRFSKWLELSIELGNLRKS
jgi:hypothetical protein